MRIPVQNPDSTPAMPTKPSRARKWVENGKAIGKWSDVGIYYVQLLAEPSDRNIQPIVVGIDPGKFYSGVAVQSAKFTLFAAHLILPFKTVKDRMDQRVLMRRGRRGRRINRKVKFNLRAHRQKRFNNRRGKKLPPSIRANRQLELRVVIELNKLFPLTQIVYEYVRARGDKSFSPVMVGQIWMLKQLESITPTVTRFGWETSNLRNQLGLVKQKNYKGDPILATHAVDGIALACSYFLRYESVENTKEHGHVWNGEVTVTIPVFRVIRRPPISRRQLHLMVPTKGGIRRKYGGTNTRHGLRKGDLVNSPKGIGYVSGDTEKQISVSNSNWNRLGQIAASKVSLIRRSNGLIVA
jgi:RRXRR protein